MRRRCHPPGDSRAIKRVARRPREQKRKLTRRTRPRERHSHCGPPSRAGHADAPVAMAKAKEGPAPTIRKTCLSGRDLARRRHQRKNCPGEITARRSPSKLPPIFPIVPLETTSKSWVCEVVRAASSGVLVLLVRWVVLEQGGSLGTSTSSCVEAKNSIGGLAPSHDEDKHNTRRRPNNFTNQGFRGCFERHDGKNGRQL